MLLTQARLRMEALHAQVNWTTLEGYEEYVEARDYLEHLEDLAVEALRGGENKLRELTWWRK